MQMLMNTTIAITNGGHMKFYTWEKIDPPTYRY